MRVPKSEKRLTVERNGSFEDDWATVVVQGDGGWRWRGD
jgi:hypothetical protein